MRRRIIIMGMALLCTFSLFMGMIANAKTKTSGVHQNQLEEYILKEMPEAHVPGMTISIVNVTENCIVRHMVPCKRQRRILQWEHYPRR